MASCWTFADGKKRGPFATKFVGHKGAVCGLKVSESQILERLKMAVTADTVKKKPAYKKLLLSVTK